MKVKENIFIQEMDGTQYLASVGGELFSGIVRCNPTAAFVINLLREERTMDEIVEAMKKEYGVPEAVLREDAAELIDSLRGLNVIQG